MLAKTDLDLPAHREPRDRRDERLARGERTRHLGRWLELVPAAVVAVVLAAFVIANQTTTDVNLLFRTATAPLWAVLSIVIVVALCAGLLVGSLGRRH